MVSDREQHIIRSGIFLGASGAYLLAGAAMAATSFNCMAIDYNGLDPGIINGPIANLFQGKNLLDFAFTNLPYIGATILAILGKREYDKL